MHKVRLSYVLGTEHDPRASEPPGLHHPLIALLDAIRRTGSISAASRSLGLSYRHVWGELKRWEVELDHTLVTWVKGKPTVLAPFGEKLLWAERRAQARLAPQIEALRSQLERAFAVAFDDSAGVITMHASHDDALPLLREWTLARHHLHLDIQFTGSVDALVALNEGHCLLAGFHALTDAPSIGSLKSPTAIAYRRLLKPGRHKLIGFARRNQGLIVAAGNPLHIHSLRDLARADVRFVNRPRGTGTRIVLQELLATEHMTDAQIPGFDRTEPSHHAVAEAVASGSADAAFGIEAAAHRRNLGFVALASERYFLVTLAASLAHPHVSELLAVLTAANWKTALGGIAGYSAERSGEVLSLRQVLPWWTYRKPKR